MNTNQVVVVPYPGRGHINPMLNLCNLLSSRINHKPDHTTFFTIVLTEEWLGLINPEPDQVNIRFVSIPNVLPSERNRGSDMLAFLTAVNTKMGDPFEEMLDKTEVPVKLIIFDATMNWPCGVAKKRNIPIAMYWPMSALMFSVAHYVDLIESHNQLYADVSERGKEPIDYIPGISSLTIADLPTFYHDKIGQKFKGVLPNIFDSTKKADYVLLSTMYELESKTIDALRVGLQIPVYTSGPNMPHSQIKPDSTSHEPIYINWLNSKPPRTVLYISMGSFLSVSRVEMDEIAAGLTESGINFLWVARGETSHLKDKCGENGMVVEWCDQLRVLSHSSIGGFWTHCGWNSVKESLFSGVPMLTFPILLDQPLNSKAIIEDWKIGKNMRKEVRVFKRDQIAQVVRMFMDSKSVERIEMMERVNKLQKVCQESVVEDGSAYRDLDAFVKEIVMDQIK
ncbi:UDP-glucuronosyl/UDP-glucosyltransferase [Artemisia annua]|uniref:UDP-glucuronosyl/UDP-glucosyltransferase n=1 Tax=Artemisia annua TaxID=35608 RepID=A0A2U1M0P9_ARTAN|nr:UDP-glucuronosyl/UDP-glucosyltransferase [Artemisia annua]